MYPLLFHDNLHELVWGGSALQPLKGLEPDGRPIGESWEISAVQGNESVVANGPFAGRTLGSLVAEYGEALLGSAVMAADGGRFPLLVKFIDAAHDLSIQVHPDDTLALQRHHSRGKTEMWYVMHAEPGASLLAGFQQLITQEDYVRRVGDGSIVDVLARHEVHAGDVFFIPAGRVHAICGGIMVCEIQQSSDITYRLFDYHRLGLDGQPRELHTELAKDAIDYRVFPSYRTDYVPPREGAVCVVDCPFFVVNVLATSTTLRRPLKATGSFVTLSCLSGTARIEDPNGHSVALCTGYSCLMPAAIADFTIHTVGNCEVRLLEAWAK